MKNSDLTACVFTTDEKTFDQCIEALNRQTVQPAAIEVIRDVNPMPKAFQEGLDRVKTLYYVSVDADMILKPKALEWLYDAITRGDDIFEAVAHLKDPIMGKIQGVHIYRTDIVRKMGGFQNDRGPERLIREGGLNAGYRLVTLDKVAGRHEPDYTPEKCFARFQECMLRFRRFDKQWEFFRHIRHFVFRYFTRRDKLYIYALCGLISGLAVPEEELDKPQGTGYRFQEMYRGLEKFLGAK